MMTATSTTDVANASNLDAGGISAHLPHVIRSTCSSAMICSPIASSVRLSMVRHSQDRSATTSTATSSTIIPPTSSGSHPRRTCGEPDLCAVCARLASPPYGSIRASYEVCIACPRSKPNSSSSASDLRQAQTMMRSPSNESTAHLHSY